MKYSRLRSSVAPGDARTESLRAKGPSKCRATSGLDALEDTFIAAASDSTSQIISDTVVDFWCSIKEHSHAHPKRVLKMLTMYVCEAGLASDESPHTTDGDRWLQKQMWEASCHL